MTDRDPHDSDLETLLGRAFRTETAGIVPAGDGLARIRDRVDGRGRTAWWKPALVLVAAAAGGLLAGGLVLPGVGGADGTASTVNNLTPAASTPSATPTPDAGSDGPAASPSATATATPTTPTSQDAGAALPVYYLHDDGSALRLYREFHLAADGGTGGEAAVREMLRGEPVDPDYTSLWAPGTELLGYAVEDGVVTVDVSAEALGMTAGSEGAATSLQQLVYTVTAAEGDADLRVRLTVEGEPVPELWGAVDNSEPSARAPMLDVQGQVWILDPTQGGQSTSPVEVTVYGTAFEGTVVLQVTATGRDEVLAEQFVTTAMGEFLDAATSFELPPGDYTVRALSEYGEAMELLERDSKEFRVG